MYHEHLQQQSQKFLHHNLFVIARKSKRKKTKNEKMLTNEHAIKSMALNK